MKQIQTRAATDYVELSLLGADGDRDPSVDTFPSKFNPQGYKVWVELMNSKTYANAKAHFFTRDEDWTWCIRTYLRMCPQAGIFPFASPTQQANNDYAIQFLTTARRRAIQFLDRIELFKKVRLFQTHRDYFITSDSLTIVTCAHLYPVIDPTFAKWLMMHSPGPMFRPTGFSSKYKREIFNNVDSRVEFEFNLVNMVRPLLKMTVACGSPVAYSRNKNAPTAEELAYFTEKTIWLPIVRSHRFKNTGNRLF